MTKSSGTHIPDRADELEQYVRESDRGEGAVKEEARAQIVWAEPASKKVTPYSIVYLHGFKASHGEGHPVHRQLAKRFGCNLYLARLSGHGLETKKGDAFKNLTRENLQESALEALRIAQKIGQKVIVMGTSTGGSLGLWLAARDNEPGTVTALLLYSPLIRFYGYTHWMLGTAPGRKLLGMVPGENFIMHDRFGNEKESRIWYGSYRLRGALELGSFIQYEMTPDTFAKIRCPLFAGYYYKNRKEQDKVVSTSAIRDMFEQVGTPSDRKKLVNFPGADSHVIASGLASKSFVNVREESVFFAEKILGLKQL